MSFFTPFREAIRALFHKRQLDAEMEEEIRHHVDLRTQEYISSGMKPEEARYAALRQFGWVESIKETCREERGTNWIEDLGQDLRHAARMLRKDSGTTLIAVLTLALGLGAVTTQFRIFNGILLRGLPFPNPERLYGIDLREPGWPADLAVAPTVADVREWQRAQQSCDGLAACDSYRWVNATLDGVALSAGGLYVTYNYFSVLGARPILGRDFSASDELPGAESVALISHRIWMTYAGGSADIVGRTMRLEGRTTTIIGVMPPGFAFPAHQEIWAPLVPGISVETPRGKSVCLIARIKEGQTLPQVQAEFTGFARRLAEEWPATNRQLTEVRVVPLHDALVGDLKGVLVAMLVAAIAVLVIACVNVMNLQLARATSRLRELALRGALGASRARLLRLMLTEGLLLVLGGVVAGLLFAHWLTPWVHASMAHTRFDAAPGWVATDSDATVLLFTVGAALLTVLGSSLVPACVASRVDPMEVIKEGSHGQSNRLVGRIGYGLVVGQTGLTCALLIASLLLVKSVRKHARASLGFPTDSVMTARISLEYGYRTPEERSRFYDRFLRELRANPDFTHAALTSRPLMIMEGWPGRCQWEPQSPNTNEAIAAVATEYVSDGYFATLGLQPREGREFEPGEPRRGLPSVIVNDTFARHYFDSASVVGRRLRMLWENGTPKEWRTVVGVVPDTFLKGSFNRPRTGAAVFLPLEESVPTYPTVVVRGPQAAKSLADPLRRALARLDPDLVPYGVGTPRTSLIATDGQSAVVTEIFTAFATVACILATVGLYGVTSFAVGRRTKDLGIRMAMGASRERIITEVLREGGLQFAIGATGGVLLALAFVHFGASRLTDFLYEVSPRDPAVYAAVVALLAVATVVACLIPARRAARVDPMVALRSD